MNRLRGRYQRGGRKLRRAHQRSCGLAYKTILRRLWAATWWFLNFVSMQTHSTSQSHLGEKPSASCHNFLLYFISLRSMNFLIHDFMISHSLSYFTLKILYSYIRLQLRYFTLRLGHKNILSELVSVIPAQGHELDTRHSLVGSFSNVCAFDSEVWKDIEKNPEEFLVSYRSWKKIMLIADITC